MLPGVPVLWSTRWWPEGAGRILAPKVDQAGGIWPLSEAPRWLQVQGEQGLGILSGP